MRCKKHMTDQTSIVGVCASCLQEKLLPILAVQNNDQSLPSISDYENTPQIDQVPVKREKTMAFCLLPNIFKSRINKTAVQETSLFSSRNNTETFVVRGRGMSPERESGFFPSERETPSRDKLRREIPRRERAVSGFVFCLSPLVRASPKRQFKSKSMPLKNNMRDVTSLQPHLGTAASSCGNRSRKIADFGRFDRRR